MLAPLNNIGPLSQPQDFVETGSSNTQLDPQTLRFDPGIDTISAMVPVETHEQVERICDYFYRQICSDEYVIYLGRSRGSNGCLFFNSGNTVKGGLIGYSLPSEEGNSGKLRLSFPGKMLGELNLYEQSHILFELIFTYRARITRCDAKVDDYGKELQKETIQTAIEDGNYKHFRQAEFRERRSRGTNEVISQGWTIYLGASTSDSRTRIYDKAAESNGEKDCYRIETEMRREKAHEFAKILCKFPYDLELISEWIIDTTLGSIDFVDRSKDASGRNVSRCPRLDWWQNFLDRVQACPIRLPMPKKERSLEKTRSWIERQVATSLSMLHDVFGSANFRQIIDEIISQGKERYTSFHEAQIKVAKAIYSKPILNSSQPNTLPPSTPPPPPQPPLVAVGGGGCKFGIIFYSLVIVNAELTLESTPN